MKHLVSVALLLVAIKTFGAFHPGTITYKNGKSRTGFIEAKLGTVVRFKPWMEAEAEEIASIGIKTVLLKTDSGRQQREYHYMNVLAGGKKVSKDPVWLKMVEKGTVSLYLQETVSRQDGLDAFEPGDYFCSRENDAAAKPVASYGNNHSFLSKAPLYFTDCPQILEKIKSKQYSWENIQEIVRAYNQWLATNKSQKTA